jgi:hypothetical protein
MAAFILGGLAYTEYQQRVVAELKQPTKDSPMFSLIITIISIALVAALALATIYYGGTAFNKGSAEAKASQLINEGQQINGAVAMNKADAASGAITAAGDVFDEATAGLSTLVASKYLAQVPGTWLHVAAATEAVSGDKAVAAQQVSADVCKAVNTKAGMTTPETVVAADLVGKQYGCITADKVVTYKF